MLTIDRFVCDFTSGWLFCLRKGQKEIDLELKTISMVTDFSVWVRHQMKAKRVQSLQAIL